MKKFIAMTIISFVGIVGNVYGVPQEDLTTSSDVIIDTTMNEEDKDIDKVIAELAEKYEAFDGAVSTVIDQEAKVRDLPSIDGNIINFMNQGQPVYVKEQVGNWYLVLIEDKECYIYNEQLDQTVLEDIVNTKIQNEEVVEEETYLGEDIVAKAKQYVGNPYVYGGTSLTNGADCSGFTQQVFKLFGINIERTSRSQYASNGYKVNKSDLLPGDLVFYGYNGVVSHVAIYAGDNQVIHANTSSTGICISSLEQSKPIIGMKRVII